MLAGCSKGYKLHCSCRGTWTGARKGLTWRDLVLLLGPEWSKEKKNAAAKGHSGPSLAAAASQPALPASWHWSFYRLQPSTAHKATEPKHSMASLWHLCAKRCLISQCNQQKAKYQLHFSTSSACHLEPSSIMLLFHLYFDPFGVHTREYLHRISIFTQQQPQCLEGDFHIHGWHPAQTQADGSQSRSSWLFTLLNPIALKASK